MTTHSTNLAITCPARWGYERVRIFFGEVRRTGSQVTLSGDIVRRLSDNTLHVFVRREANLLVLNPALSE